MWDFIQYQILVMKWMEELIGDGLAALGLDTATRIGGSIHFLSMT